MSYMRMSNKPGHGADVQERVVGYRYYFTHSKWQAMAHISNRMIMECGEVDWRTCFPLRAAAAMHYGLLFGLDVQATEYSLVDAVDTKNGIRRAGDVVGVLASVYSGDKLMGFYAVKY